MAELSLEEKAASYDTCLHIRTVQHFMHAFIKNLLSRIEEHDKTKLASPEVELFTKYASQLKGTTYGSKEYEQFRECLGPALKHHYANNRHHPEFFPNGINDMNLLDLAEMFCDWLASSKRHDDGDINKSIDINSERFQMSPQLTQIFKNTVEYLERLNKAHED